MVSQDNILERKYCIECDPEMVERINSILIKCLEKCQNSYRQKRRITADSFSHLARETLYVLGACLHCFQQSGVRREDTRLHGKRADNAMISLRSTLETLLDDRCLQESTRHAAAGVIDTGFELVYPSSTQRVALIAGLLKRYSKEPFTEDSGSHMLLLHVLNRLRRVGGSLSMLPSTNVTFDDEQLNEAVMPFQLWLRMLDRKNSRSRKERRPSRGIKIDAAPLAAGLLASIFRHLCVQVGRRVERTERIGDGGVLEVPVLNLLDYSPSRAESNHDSLSRDSSSEYSLGAGGAGESKRQLASIVADNFHESASSSNPLAGLVEDVIDGRTCLLTSHTSGYSGN